MFILTMRENYFLEILEKYLDLDSGLLIDLLQHKMVAFTICADTIIWKKTIPQSIKKQLKCNRIKIPSQATENLKKNYHKFTIL